uniref:DUF4283 domain-containing protein n=1 Tax=Kalanchoe fedtschenkoi TaxID=63787 RepID=A0A7N0SYM8_KALFE
MAIIIPEWNRPFLLKEWNPDERFDLHKIEDIPVWIRLPELLPNLWRADILSKIVSQVGRPIRTDAFTAKGEKLMYARVLVSISAKNEPRDSITIHGPGGRSFIQAVIYEWMPPRCSFCQCFGHKTDECAEFKEFMNPHEPTEQAPDEEHGFIPEEVLVAERVRWERNESMEKALVVVESPQSSSNASHVSPTKSLHRITNGSERISNALVVATPNAMITGTNGHLSTPTASKPNMMSGGEKSGSPKGQVNRFNILSDDEIVKAMEEFEDSSEAGFQKVGKKRDKRGVNHPSKQAEVIQLVKKWNINVLAVLECKVNPANFALVSNKLKSSLNWQAVGNSGDGTSSNRIILLWDSSSVTVEVWLVEDQVIFAKLRWQNSSIFVAFIYAANFAHQRSSLWNSLKHQMHLFPGPWLVVGDFNCVGALDERDGGTRLRDRDTQELAAVYDSCGLADIKAKGRFFTWSNMQGGSSRLRARLDRCMMALTENV